ncbi:xanthine dehydrogenase accessory factor [Lachnospiraceae bacterium PM6-15]|uniref:xanthine dehydrogenase accessory protein XdhC n=1 Tax=Ohessyouella blattaphilus TaxID=2949333 RepID=UPI003E1999D9
MRELFACIKEYLEQGEDVVLVTIVSSSGSTPRGMGAKMLVTKEGRVLGTIGGGQVEHVSEQTALSVLAKKQSQLSYYQLKQNEIQDLGMICGGDVTVYEKYIAGTDESFLKLCTEIEELYEERGRGWLAVETKKGSRGEMRLLNKQEELAAYEGYYIEEIKASERVYIFGGGHVSQALVPVLFSLDFSCIVLDDREEFTQPELFPSAAETILIDQEAPLEPVQIQADDYVVIMTRGHKDDQRVLAEALRTRARYIGVIGSRKKKAGVFARLQEMGFTEESLARITTPIGLDIGAKTPAEIAISIAGQLIQERYRK